jgi:hypothetical protein
MTLCSAEELDPHSAQLWEEIWCHWMRQITEDDMPHVDMSPLDRLWAQPWEEIWCHWKRQITEYDMPRVDMSPLSAIPRDGPTYIQSTFCFTVWRSRYGSHSYCHVSGRVTSMISTWIRIATEFHRSRLQPQQITSTGNTLALAASWNLLVNLFWTVFYGVSTSTSWF